MNIIIALAICTAIGFFFLYRKHKQSELEIKQLKEYEAHFTVNRPKITDIKIDKKNSPLPDSIGLDTTKLASRQPGNQSVIPYGFKEMIKNIDGETIAHIQKIYPIGFTYKFFGSSLVLDKDMVIISGLIPRLHILEVDEHGSLRIDNQDYKIHPDVVERLRVIANTREE